MGSVLPLVCWGGGGGGNITRVEEEGRVNGKVHHALIITRLDLKYHHDGMYTRKSKMRMVCDRWCEWLS